MRRVIILFLFVCSLVPYSGYGFEIDDLKSCAGVAVKTLVKSDTLAPENKSKASEIRNIRNLEKIFGTDKQMFDSQFHFMGSDQSIDDSGRTTWYNFASKKTNKPLYRLYYTKNKVMENAHAGDLLVVCKQDDFNVLLLVAQKDSPVVHQVREILGLNTPLAPIVEPTFINRLTQLFAKRNDSEQADKKTTNPDKNIGPEIPKNAWIRVYFTPGPECENNIIAEIERTKKKIDVAVYSITNQRIVDALVAAHNRNVKVRILTDRIQSKGKHSLVKQLKAAGLPIVVNRGHKIMHNKFAIFDKKDIESGSYNWTESATKSNAENCMFFPEPDKKFTNEFTHLWNLYQE